MARLPFSPPGDVPRFAMCLKGKKKPNFTEFYPQLSLQDNSSHYTPYRAIQVPSLLTRGPSSRARSWGRQGVWVLGLRRGSFPYWPSTHGACDPSCAWVGGPRDLGTCSEGCLVFLYTVTETRNPGINHRQWGSLRGSTKAGSHCCSQRTLPS